MASIIASPARYIQGRNELSRIRTHVGELGTKLYIIVSPSGKSRVEESIQTSLADQSQTAKQDESFLAVYENFNGECCMTEINRILAQFKESGCDLIVGIGGGKIHDTAKAVAYYAGVPVVIVPTIASTDAPCSALSVIYSDDGVFERYLFLPSSPDIVLVDTEIISKAPARLLVSGMGDALATYFEARACKASGASNCVGGKPTLAAMGLAKLCYDTLMADGVKAAIAAENHVCTKALENIVEANTYLSGIGFESGGLAAAHAIHNGLTVIEETHALYHGEKVAFGTLVQLVLENAPESELTEVLEFCQTVGLPTTLEDLGVLKADPDKLMRAAKLACSESDTLHNMPFAVAPESVYDAILAADALGRFYKDGE